MAGHVLPQPPQFFGSLPVLVQVPWQSTSLRPQVRTGPARCCCPPGVFPQAPQLFGSVFSETQVPLHETVPAAQLHIEPTQTWVAPQITEQLPQWLWSLPRLTHDWPHCTSGGVHWDTQVPCWQKRFPAQTVLQPPQLFGSLITSWHAPLQNSWPEGQVHSPLVQVCPGPQALPQAPQLLLSLPVSTQVMPTGRLAGRAAAAPVDAVLGRQARVLAGAAVGVVGAEVDAELAALGLPGQAARRAGAVGAHAAVADAPQAPQLLGSEVSSTQS